MFPIPRFIAVRVERDDDGDNEVEIEGPIGSVAAPESRIAGIRILTNTFTEFERDDETITAAEFFAIALGRLAEVDGTWNGEVVVAEDVELHNSGTEMAFTHAIHQRR